MYRNFEEIADAARANPVKRNMVVGGAADEAVLKAVIQASDAGIVVPILVGESADIRSILEKMGENPANYAIVQAAKGEEPDRCVDLIKSGDADIMMKGMIDTGPMLRPLVKKENNLRTGSVMSHVVFFDKIPHYDKLLLQTDGGMVMYPTLEDKKGIIENAVRTLHTMGNTNPSVAALAAIEKVNPKMKETVDAAALKQMNLNGEITGCVIEGPVSYDIAMNAEIAHHKGFDCPYCGNFDVLLVPDMTCGNILAKSWIITAGAQMAGIIVGAKVPVVMTSRGASADEKFYSIALAAVTTGGVA